MQFLLEMAFMAQNIPMEFLVFVSWEPVTQHRPVGPSGAGMLTFCLIVNTTRLVVLWGHATNSGSVENKDMMMDQSRSLRKDQSNGQEERTEGKENSLKTKCRIWKRDSTLPVECGNSCLPSNPLWYFKLASGLVSEDASRVGGVWRGGHLLPGAVFQFPKTTEEWVQAGLELGSVTPLRYWIYWFSVFGRSVHLFRFSLNLLPQSSNLCHLICSCSCQVC